MKILFWNARGIANLPTRLVLKNLCSKHKPDVVILVEPWMLFSDLPSTYWTSLGFKLFAVNNRDQVAPNLWCLCRTHLEANLVAASKQQVSFSMSFADQLVYIFAVYASTTYFQRRLLWTELSALQQNDVGPWCYIGDFNAVLGAHERRGGPIPSHASCADF